MSQPEPANLAAEMVAFMAAPVDHLRFKDEGDKFLLRLYANGERTISVREDTILRGWGPETTLHPEPVAELLAGANADCALLDEMGR